MWERVEMAKPYVGPVAKWDGRAATGAAIAYDVYDVATAPEGQRAKTAAQDAGGFVGTAGGAIAGAQVGMAVAPFLGPLAPAAPVLGAIGGAILGSNVGRNAGKTVAGWFGW